MKVKLFPVFIIAALLFSARVLAQDEPPPPDNNQVVPDFSDGQVQQDQQNEAQAVPENYEEQQPQSYSGQEQIGNISVKQDKISLDIKGMDIVDVLKMLSSRANMNMVIGRNVTGRVTLFLKDVDVWEAFEIILLANDLAYDRKGGIINVMTQRDYELIYGERYQDKKQARVIELKYAKAADLSKALNQIKTNVGRVIVDEGSNTVVLVDAPQKVKEMEEFIAKTDKPLETRIYGLNYAQAEKVSAKLQEALTKGVGSMKIDERTNKIVITDYPERLTEIGRIISAFDEKTPQVLIDAQILEITPNDKLEAGVDWDFFIKKHFRMQFSMPTSTAFNAGRLFMGTQAIAPTEKGDYKSILDVLRTIGDTKVLSSPRIMALNNQEAKILVGTKQAYVTSSTSQAGTGTEVTSQSVNFVDVGIKLNVTPTINRDGFVTMKIKPEVSSASATPAHLISGGQQTDVPIVTTSEAETTVMIKDGVTVLIGGLRKDQDDKQITKIPILGDIPVIGLVFGKYSHNKTKDEIVILLTPHIISGESMITDFEDLATPTKAVIKIEKSGNATIERSPQKAKDAQGADPAVEYYNFVVRKVQEVAMIERPKGEKGAAEIEFTLTRKGRLAGEPQVVSLDNPALEPFIIRAIKSASPFPPFPGTLQKDKQAFRISLYYE